MATIRLRAGSKVQLSAKWKLPYTFTLLDIGTAWPASFVAPSGVPALKGCGPDGAGACANATPAVRRAVAARVSVLLLISGDSLSHLFECAHGKRVQAAATGCEV